MLLPLPAVYCGMSRLHYCMSEWGYKNLTYNAYKSKQQRYRVDELNVHNIMHMHVPFLCMYEEKQFVPMFVKWDGGVKYFDTSAMQGKVF